VRRDPPEECYRTAVPHLTLASFNICHGGRSPRRGFAPYDVVTACRELSADVLVLPETTIEPNGNRSIDALVDDGYTLTDIYYGRTTDSAHPRARPDGVLRFGIAVLSRLPVLASKELSMGRVRTDPIRNRRALQVTVEVDGRPLHVIGVHTSSQVPIGGIINLRALAPQIPRDEPAVVAGDCNLWGPPVVACLPGWRRAVLGRTWPSHRPHSQIDHILVNDHVQVLHGEVLGDTGSDHRPVRARLAFNA
jgi:endonuclease/exonuclease/phosphatase family metal-dependent hydrolase